MDFRPWSWLKWFPYSFGDHEYKVAESPSNDPPACRTGSPSSVIDIKKTETLRSSAFSSSSLVGWMASLVLNPVFFHRAFLAIDILEAFSIVWQHKDHCQLELRLFLFSSCRCKLQLCNHSSKPDLVSRDHISFIFCPCSRRSSLFSQADLLPCLRNVERSGIACSWAFKDGYWKSTSSHGFPGYSAKMLLLEELESWLSRA